MEKSIRTGVVASLAVILALGVASVGHAGANPSKVSPLRKSVPHGVEDLRAIEQAAQAVAKKLVPCTVGLSIGPRQGSGVIISEDGYVLTAAHVSGAPGLDAQVRFADGRLLQAKTLGMHLVADIALAKIVGDVKLPFVQVVPRDEAAKAGDWCVAAGHPNGFMAERGAPVRLGRIIDIREDVVRTDCPVMGGDSGGPLFDLQGRVIGIHSRIGEDLTFNLHGPALVSTNNWEQLLASSVLPIVPPSRFLDRLDIDHDGSLTRAELPEGGYLRRVFERLATRYSLDVDKAHPVEELARRLDLKATAQGDFGMSYEGEDRVTQSLFSRLFVRGESIRDAFAPIVEPIRGSLVQVESSSNKVALGAVVSADGLIATKASQLAGEIYCRLPEGKRHAAKIVATDRGSDLALLRISAKELPVIEWADSGSLAPGSWLITPDLRGVASVGVLSVGERTIVGVPGVLGIQLADSKEIARVVRIFPNSGAFDAQLMENDVITHVMDRAVRNIDDLKGVLQDFRAGDVVKLKLARGTETVETEITLGAPEDVFFSIGRAHVNGELSKRRDDFRRAVQHDTVLAPNECGGPILDLSGKVVGFNIARADRISTLALPTNVVRPVIERLVAKANE